MTGLWRALFWREHRMSEEYGPPPAVEYAHLMVGLTNSALLVFHDDIVAEIAAAKADARRTADAVR